MLIDCNNMSQAICKAKSLSWNQSKIVCAAKCPAAQHVTAIRNNIQHYSRCGWMQVD